MATIKDFKTIIKPIITEKSSMGSEYNQVTFQVQKTSSKKEIKLAIENIFKVKVKKVNTSIVRVNLNHLEVLLVKGRITRRHSLPSKMVKQLILMREYK